MSLVAENIVVSFSGREVLKGVTIRADKGKVTGLLGRNGCGKSTMLKVIFGTQTATDRIVQFSNKSVKFPYKQNSLVNYLPQFPFFPKGLKVKDAVKQFQVNEEDILERFPELYQEINRPFTELSGGMERLFSALLLLFAPTEYTLMDEPFTHVMPLHVERLKQVITIQKEKKGIILTDHMYRHITELSDMLYIIKDGQSFVVKERTDLVFHGYVNALVE